MKNIIALLFALLPALAYSHGGRTDQYGGHTDSSTGLYHFHSSAAYKLPSAAVSKVWSWATSSDSGSSRRDPSQRRAFHASHPCPSTGRTSGACPGYHVDHITPLACGGADAPYNMQWLPARQNLSKGSMGCRYD